MSDPHDGRRRHDRQERQPDDVHLPADASQQERQEAGDRLRERIYVTFTALAILMALNAHGEHLDSPTVLWTLLISVVGVLLAGLASDLVSHMIVHDTLPSAREFRHMLAVASRALGVIAVPVVVLVLAYFEVMAARTAVIVAISALIASLAVIARIAVSRTGLAGWKQLIVLVGIVLLGVIVVFLEQLAH